ncbi:MAG: tRNA uridine-5-carboxymethylaminomethyl(34) synthesis GTPase MnmE [Treponema sp.]|jgi:tRNA modification GTPase|nr:tRNA uridine-5-carboxymethylaminomethyl(34) synthesis GTPase MnmE [Treponema sp.]
MRRYGDRDPIAARATGQGALATVRTSGGGSLELLARVFSRPRALLDAPGNTVVYGWIVEPGASGQGAAGPNETRRAGPNETCRAGPDEPRRVDEVLVSVYRAPKSYTGEDGADISCHGGEAVIKAVLETLRKAGFSDALAGEFSFRAFMNGRIDLTRSESVMELVSAKTGKAAERALRRLSGVLEREFHEIREKLLESLSAAEIFLDYPEDEIDGEAGLLPYREAAEEALERLEALAASYRRERLYREGAAVVIAGRPNAGKSSLFNALLREDRSIVTEHPGTTRDWIEASLSFEGIPVRLIDTAGLREDSPDPVEKIGVGRSREMLENADLVVYVIDGTAGVTGEDRAFFSAPQKIIPVWNKADIVPAGSRPGEIPLPEKPTALSAKTGEGIETLCRIIAERLFDSKARSHSADGAPAGTLHERLEPAHGLSGEAGLGSDRQKDLVDRAVFSLREALSLADKKETLELIAPFLREALNAVGEITGEISTADILEAMFSRFCVGK